MCSLFLVLRFLSTTAVRSIKKESHQRLLLWEVSVMQQRPSEEVFPLFLLARMLEYAKAKPLCIEMRRSLHVEGWGEVSGNVGSGITGAAWWKPR